MRANYLIGTLNGMQETHPKPLGKIAKSKTSNYLFLQSNSAALNLRFYNIYDNGGTIKEVSARTGHGSTNITSDMDASQ